MCENTRAGDVWFARSWYQYDNVGREVATWRDEQSGKGERYWYNATNQLMSARYNADQVSSGTAVNPTRAVDYQYEAGLNRTWMNDNGQTTSYTVNWMNQDIGLNWVGSLYDQNFNLYTLDGWRYDYDADKHLVLTTDGTNTGEFVYDGLGRCVKRTINGVATIITYDAWKPTMEWDGNGNLSALNVYGPGADEILYRYVAAGSQRFRYHHDIHGNVTFLLDWAGDQIIEKYTYDAFGKPTILSANDTQLSTSAYGNRFMFQGREYLSELGIYDYRHRMYQPQLGRFLQTDPLGLQTEGEKLSTGQKALFSPGGVAPEAFTGSEMNLFRYCGDDPVDKNDPLGLYAPEIQKFDDADKKLIQDQINAYKEKSKAFRDEYAKWENDKVNRYILPASDPGNTKGKQVWNSAVPQDNGFFSRKGPGGTVYYNPQNGKTENGRDRDPIYGLAHELGHLSDYAAGNYPTSLMISRAESRRGENVAIGWEREAQRAFGVSEKNLRPFEE
jgi:RHS repeat-associated protein